MDFESYKKKRKDVSSLLGKLSDANDSKKGDYTDERQYQYTKDASGNSFAIIRFLPSKSDLASVVSRYSHGFKNFGKWYIENCPTTIKGKCPACESNSVLWNTGTKKNQDIVRSRSRRKEYFGNVYIIKDSIKPENEDKVFIWKFGQKVYDKILAQLKPDNTLDVDAKPVNVFDMFEGANFKLNIKTVKGYSNYDNCSFMEKSPLTEDEKKAEEIFGKIYDLSEFVSPSAFKNYEELSKRLNLVLNQKDMTATVADEEEKPPVDDDDEEGEEAGESSDEGTDEYFNGLK